jgi:hypothetical protein
MAYPVIDAANAVRIDCIRHCLDHVGAVIRKDLPHAKSCDATPLCGGETNHFLNARIDVNVPLFAIP